METDIDHIHILVDVDPQFGVMKFVKQAKGRSSRLLRQEFHHLTTRLPTLWTNSSFISTGNSVGIDFGLKKFLTLSNKQSVKSPLFHLNNLSDIKRLNRNLSKY